MAWPKSTLRHVRVRGGRGDGCEEPEVGSFGRGGGEVTVGRVERAGKRAGERGQRRKVGVIGTGFQFCGGAAWYLMAATGSPVCIASNIFTPSSSSTLTPTPASVCVKSCVSRYLNLGHAECKRVAGFVLPQRLTAAFTSACSHPAAKSHKVTRSLALASP